MPVAPQLGAASFKSLERPRQVSIAERDAGIRNDPGELVRFGADEGAQLGVGHAARHDALNRELRQPEAKGFSVGLNIDPDNIYGHHRGAAQTISWD